MVTIPFFVSDLDLGKYEYEFGYGEYSEFIS